jgi:hypothetical protein
MNGKGDKSASDFNDRENYDFDSMFNVFKRQRKTAFSKAKKVYAKYVPEEDSNFNPKNRGF